MCSSDLAQDLNGLMGRGDLVDEAREFGACFVAWYLGHEAASEERTSVEVIVTECWCSRKKWRWEEAGSLLYLCWVLGKASELWTL